jgi:hypothetical protein
LTRDKEVNSETLAKRWNIDQRKALNTVKQTTQHGVWSCLYPALSRRTPTNDMMLRYTWLPHPVFSDKLNAGVLSTRGNTYGQAFCTQYDWLRAHPMEKKSDAHEALSLVLKRGGVPLRMVVDNLKEQTLGTFAKKCCKADCHLVTTEPYSPWIQAEEDCIKQTISSGLHGSC